MEIEKLQIKEERTVYMGSVPGFYGRVFGGFEGGQFTFDYADRCDIDPDEFEKAVETLTGDERGILRDRSRMTSFCAKHREMLIKGPFKREYIAFKGYTDNLALYFLLKPWNEGSECEIYILDRNTLSIYLSELRGLKPMCFGVLPFTGERIMIRYPETTIEVFPQYGRNADDNSSFADGYNEGIGVSKEIREMMEEGAVYGWDEIDNNNGGQKWQKKKR